MTDNKLRCAMIYRLEGSGPTAVVLASYDHAAQYETHGGSDQQGLYGGKGGDYAKAVSKVIGNDPPGGLAEGGKVGGFKVVQSDQHQVVYGADKDGLCYCVITGLGYQSRVAIQFLEELATEFSAKFGADAKTAKENALNKKAKKILTPICKKYEDPGNVDKAQKVLGQVEKVKGTMQDNIANMLKNTEQAESLAEKSDQLNEQASVFKKNSKTLKKQMAWKNLKMTLILGGVVIIILIVILVPLIVKLKQLAK